MKRDNSECPLAVGQILFRLSGRIGRPMAIILLLLAVGFPAKADPPPAPTIPVKQPVICTGEGIEATVAVLTNYVVGENIQWYAAATGGESLPSSTVLAYDKKYYASQTVNGLESTDRAEISTKNLNAVTPGTIQTARPIVCMGQNASISNAQHAANSIWMSMTISYQWEYSTDGGDTWQDAPGGSAARQEGYTFFSLQQETVFRRRADFMRSGQHSCTVYSNPITIAINWVDGGEVAGDQAICRWQIPPKKLTSVSPGDGAGEISYHWRRSDNPGGGVHILAGYGEEHQPTATQGGGFLYQRVTTSKLGGINCEAVSNSVSIAVHNIVTAGAIGSEQAICQGDTPAVLTSVDTARSDAWNRFGLMDTITYQWKWRVDGGNWIDIPGATEKTFAPGELQRTTFFARWATSTLFGHKCGVENAPSVTVYVVSTSAGTITISSDTIACVNQPAGNLGEKSGGNAGGNAHSWFWEKSPTGDPEGNDWTPIPGEHNRWGYSPGVLTADTWYRRGISVTRQGLTCFHRSNVVPIRVHHIDPGKVSGNQATCGNEVPPDKFVTEIPAVADGALSYYWRRGYDPLRGPHINAGTGEEHQPDVRSTVGLRYDRVAVSTLDLGDGKTHTCQAASNEVLLATHRLSFAGGIAGGHTICEGAEAQKLTSTDEAQDGVGNWNLFGMVDTISYQWQKRPESSPSWINIDGATELALDSPGVLQETTLFRRMAISTLLDNSCEKASNEVRITVNRLSAGTIGPADQIVCAGASATGLDSRNGDNGFGGSTYFWQKSPTGDPKEDDWETIPNETNRWYHPGVLTADTWYRRGRVGASTDSSCTAYSNIVAVRLDKVDPGTITAPLSVCPYDTPIKFKSADEATGLGQISYQWWYNTNGGTNWTRINGATDKDYTRTAPLTQTTWFVRQAISTSMVNGVPKFCGDYNNSNVVRVRVNAVTAGSINGPQTICQNEKPATLTNKAIAQGPAGATLSYRWEYSKNGVDSWKIIPGTHPKAGSYSPQEPLSVSTWFRRVAISTLDTSLCEAPSAPVAVTVNELFPGGISADQAVCVGEMPEPIVNDYLGFGDGTVTYTWQRSLNGGITWANIPNQMGQDYTPTNPVTVTTMFRRMAFGSINGMNCSVPTDPVIITANKVHPGAISSQEQEICRDATPAPLNSIDPASGTANFTYEWQYSTDGGSNWHSAPGTNNEEHYQPDALSETTEFRRAATINGSQCRDFSNSLRVKVTAVPAPEGNAILRDCSNTSGRTLAYADGYYDPTLSWYEAPDGGTALDRSHPLLDGKTYYAAQTVNGCGSTDRLAVTYRQNIAFDHGSIGGEQTVCSPSGTPAALTGTAASHTEGAVSYQWFVKKTDGTEVLVGHQQEIAVPKLYPSAEYLHNDHTNKYFRIARLKVTDNGQDYACEGGAGEYVSIKLNDVNPGSISLDKNSPTTVCPSMAPKIILGSEKLATSATSAAITYRWEKSTDGGNTWEPANGTMTDGKKYELVDLLQTTSFRRMAIPNGNDTCARPSNVVTINVRPKEECEVLTEKFVTDASGNGKAEGGEELTYTIKLWSNFANPIMGVKITDDLSAHPGLDGLISNITSGGSDSGRVITWNNITIPGNGTGDQNVYVDTSVSFTVKAAANLTDLDKIRNSVTVSNLPPEVTPNPQTAYVDIETNPEPKFDAMKKVADATNDQKAQANEVLTYTISIENTGSVDLTNLTVSDAIPAGTTYVANSASDGGTLSGGILNWTVDVPYGTTKQLTFEVKVADDLLAIAQISNTAIVGGEATNEATIPTDRQERLKLEKSVDRTKTYKLDDNIPYTITVTNTGNITLKNIRVEDPNANSTLVGIIPSLAPLGSKEMKAYHTVRQADVDKGHVYNQATARFSSTLSGNDSVVSSIDPTPCNVCLPDPINPCPDCTVVPVAQGAGGKIALTKVVKNRKSIYQLGDTIAYEITVENTGTLTLTDIAVTDPNADIISDPSNPNPIPILAPKGSKTFLAQHKVVQADVQAGLVDNLAAVAGKDPNNKDVTAESTDPTCPTCSKTTVPVKQNIEMAVEKKVLGNQLTYKLGEVVNYQIKVTNTGDVTLTDIAVTDPNANIISDPSTNPNPIPSLAPKASRTFQAQHTVTQADVDAGRVDNLAVAVGKDPSGGSITEESEDPTCPTCPDTTVPVDQNSGSSISLTKTAKDANRTYKLGEVIEYEITVENTGDLTLTDVEVTDPNAEIISDSLTNPNPIPSLAPKASKTFLAQHTVVQADVDAGRVDNIAVVVGKDPQDNAVTGASVNVSVNVDQNSGSSMLLTKTAKDANRIYKLGEMIEYTITVENTGTLTLTDVEVTDPNAEIISDSLTNPNPIPSLAPKASKTFLAQHTVVQADVDAGRVDNIAVAMGRDPNNKAVTDESAKVSVAVEQGAGAGMTLTKTVVNQKSAYALGDVLEYAITVKNTGSLTLRDIEVTDANADAPNNSWTVSSLAPGADTLITAWHLVVPADVDAGRVDNIAFAKGQDPENKEVTAESKKVSVAVSQNPNMALKKQILNKKLVYKIGDVVEYAITVENTGDVTLRDIKVTDANADAPNNSWTVDSLAFGEVSAPLLAQHTVVQADVDAGRVDNIAVAVGKDPKGGSITEESEDPNCPTCPETTVPVDQGKGAVILLTKKVKNAKSIYKLGDLVEYVITVENTGDLTLRDIKVTDANADAPNNSWTVDSLAPGATSAMFSAQHKVAQLDADSARVDNIAVAEGRDPAGNAVSAQSDTISVAVSQNPGIAMTKKVVDPKPVYTFGDVIEYAITVKNTGDVTLRHIRVTDDRADEVKVWTIWELTSGADSSITVTHTVEQAEVDVARVDNIAFAEGRDPRENALTAESEKVSVAVSQNPDMSLTKAAATKTISAIGDVIDYTITVTNTGDVTLRNIVVTDDNADQKDVGTIDSLAPGAASVTFLAQHTVTEEDTNRGYVPNVALATGKDPMGNEVTAESTNPDYTDDEPTDPNCPTCTMVRVRRHIEAVDDSFAVTWLQSRSVAGSVLDNDLLDSLLLDPARIVLRPLTPSDPGLLMRTDGTIVISSTVMPGSYTYPYRICELANPDNCSQAVATIEIHEQEREQVFIPNVFSPNGDGTNDFFEISKIDIFERVSVEVINRWGNQLYHNEDYHNDWDGGDLATGTYFYIIKLYRNGQENRKIKGWVSILR